MDEEVGSNVDEGSLARAADIFASDKVIAFASDEAVLDFERKRY